MKFNIKGYKLIDIFYHQDERGNFQKVFNKDVFEANGIKMKIEESYISISKKNSLRGMHYQKEPYGHDKLVACVNGKALDVCIDLRMESKSFGKIDSVIIEPGSKAIFVPRGVAHGFYALEDNTIMTYYTSSVYNRKYDSGILWSSIGFNWPDANPKISERDQKHPLFSEIKDD